MSHKPDLSKRCFLMFYVGIWSILLIAAGAWLTAYLCGTLGDPLAGKGLESADAKVFDSVLALTDKKVVRYLGEWEFLEPKLPGHFHHIGRWYQSDEWNFCIECHGPIPHSRSLKERAFLNMHGLFISCQVCHVQESQGVVPDRFGWVDMTTGALGANPEMVQGVWGEYGAKIVPLTGPAENPQPLSLEEEQEFAREFRQRMNSINDSQKVIGNKFIHRKCVENPVRCSGCHDAESQFLPYTALGYPPERAAFLVSAEVVDLVRRYETFHMPNLLNPEEQQEQGTEEETQ
ncbi:MAG: hypothetical protein JSW66_10140 [Phycisphaerales bacterium]|nr:MAG: hypothetical protein JSW66_10140 [Phycisphaerales bacterium]